MNKSEKLIVIVLGLILAGWVWHSVSEQKKVAETQAQQAPRAKAPKAPSDVKEVKGASAPKAVEEAKAIKDDQSGQRFHQKFTTLEKSSAFRLAPPIRPPSISGIAMSSEAFFGFMLPPYWMRTSSATA